MEALYAAILMNIAIVWYAPKIYVGVMVIINWIEAGKEVPR